jgi:hypothetical protein
MRRIFVGCLLGLAAFLFLVALAAGAFTPSETAFPYPGPLESFHRRSVPLMTISTCRLPQREQTSRGCQSATVVQAR